MQTGFAHLTLLPTETYPQSSGLSIYPAPQRPSKLERLGPLEMPLSLLVDLLTVPMVRLFPFQFDLLYLPGRSPINAGIAIIA